MGRVRKKSKKSHRSKSRDRVRKDDPSAPNPSGVTRKICDLMTSDKAISLSDVTLVSLDNAEIPALRALLVIRSPYFEKLFTSDFVEKGSSVVPISLRAAPLRHVLNYIYTDNCEMVRNAINAKPDVTSMGCQLTLEVIELALAADYVEVHKLLQWCKDALRTEMVRKRHPLCIILAKLHSFNTVWSTELKEQALASLIEGPEQPLLNNCDACGVAAGVLSFNEDMIEEIFTRINAKNDEMQGILFQVLLVWANGGYGHNKNWAEGLLRIPPVFVDPNQMDLSESTRMIGAKRIAKMFDLSKFSAKTLVGVVETSGLCTANDILDAYRQLALKAENPPTISRRTWYPVCKSSDENDEEQNEEDENYFDDSDDSDDSDDLLGL